MLFEVNLPSLSPTMEEGKIVKWVKKEKDPILSGEVLFEVETDKATMEYESPEDGYIVKILTSEGEIAKVNELVAIISDSQNVEESELNKFISGNNLNSVELKNSSEIESNEVLSSNSSKKIQITPLAKKISKLKGINIEKIIPASRRIHLSDLNQITTEGNNPSVNNKLFISPFAKVLAKERSIILKKWGELITENADDLAKIREDLGITVHNFDDLDQWNNLDDVAALCTAIDVVVSNKTTVPLISVGVGTVTKLANWRQSTWNNILHNPVGSSVEIFERDTWEPWDNVFKSIAEDISKLK